MKKAIFLIFVCILITNLSGCIADSSPTDVNLSQSKIHTAELNETVELKNLKFTTIDITVSNGNGLVVPNEGMEFVAVKFRVENTSESDQLVSALVLFDSYADNQKCLYAPAASTIFGAPINGTLSAGKSLEGYHYIETPVGSQHLTLEFSGTYRTNSNEKFEFEIPQ